MPRQTIKIEAPELRCDPERMVHPFEWHDVFGIDAPVEIEIGIGKGRFLLEAAALRPEVLHFGVEWANKYLRFAESRAGRRKLENVRFARVDAKEMVHRAVPTGSVTAYYVFYPDPWPKKRHHKRRFMQKDTVDHLARTLVDNGLLHVATDHEEYWAAIEETMAPRKDFQRLPEFGGDRFPLPVDQPLTNFEEKYRVEGRRRLRASWLRVSRV